MQDAVGRQDAPGGVGRKARQAHIGGRQVGLDGLKERIEAVDHVPGNVTIQGASSGDGFQAPAASSNPVLGISGGGVTLDNLTISGGATALWVHSGANAVGTQLQVWGCNQTADQAWVAASTWDH